MLMCSVHDDEAVARRELAAQIAFYTAPKAYAPMLEASGFAAEAERVRKAFAERDHEGMIAAVSDPMLEAIGVVARRQSGQASQRRSADSNHVALYLKFTMTTERILREHARPRRGRSGRGRRAWGAEPALARTSGHSSFDRHVRDPAAVRSS